MEFQTGRQEMVQDLSAGWACWNKPSLPPAGTPNKGQALGAFRDALPESKRFTRKPGRRRISTPI